MMNLKINEINVGDKFKQVKSLGSYLFEDMVFTVKEVDRDKSAILLSLKSEKTDPHSLMYAQVYLSLNELNEAFEELKKRVFGNWENINETKFANEIEDLKPEFVYQYKTNGKIVYVKTTYCNKIFKAKASCHVDDLPYFNLETGVNIAVERVNEKIKAYKIEHQTKIKVGDRVRAINNDNAGGEFVFPNATGTVIEKNYETLKVRWDEHCASPDYEWYICTDDVELIDDSEKDLFTNFKIEYINDNIFNAPINSTILHTIYAESEGEAIGLTQEIIEKFDIKPQLKKELEFLLNISDFYKDNENLLGDIIFYDHKNVITLVTKRKKHDKVTYRTIERGLTKLKKHMEDNHIHYLALPKICTGYEKLDWVFIEAFIKKVFISCSIPITFLVYSN